MSMPHVPPIGGGNQQDRQNRKLLLEHLQEQKKRLQHGHHSSSISPTPSMSTSPATMLSNPSSIPGLSAAEYATISNPAQRAALQHAHVNSVGFFITQDSAFGNLILPVLPRVPIPDVKPDTK